MCILQALTFDQQYLFLYFSRYYFELIKRITFLFAKYLKYLLLHKNYKIILLSVILK